MWTQFFGALNDNVLKNALVVLLAFKGIELWGLKSESLVSLATMIFILPFFLFSALAGQLADKYDKAFMTRMVKNLELVIMGLGTLGLFAEFILRTMNVDPALITPAMGYLRAVACGFPAVALYHVLRCFSDGLGIKSQKVGVFRR